MVSLDWKINYLIPLFKELNSVMNIIEIKADPYIHSFQQNENIS